MNTIQLQWEEFKAKVVPKEAGSTQVEEMRRSFYAGAIAMFGIQLTIGGESISEKAGVAMLQGCAEELDTFVKDLMRRS